MPNSDVEDLPVDDDVKPGNIMIGTSGFSYSDWVGPVYPDDIKKEDMLPFYFNELGLDVVELNETYNTLPTVSFAKELLAEGAPAGFNVVVRAHKSMTGNIFDRDGAYIRDENSVGLFMEGIEPLVTAGVVKCILAQFPMRFTRSYGAFAHVKWLARSVAPVPLVVEFRSAGWLAQSVFNELRELDIGFCAVDGPVLPEFPAFTLTTTASISCVRFCGRNKNWFTAPGQTRYNYNYPDFELRELPSSIRKLSEASDVIVLFNNYVNGSAVANAKRMQTLLLG